MKAKIEIEIEMNNAAFEEAGASELVRILRYCASRIEDGHFPHHALRDINGNKIGKFEVITDEAKAPELLGALKDVVMALNLAFEAEGDTFGKCHNTASEALAKAEQLIAEVEGTK